MALVVPFNLHLIIRYGSPLKQIDNFAGKAFYN